jgi:hypothetical protein
LDIRQPAWVIWLWWLLATTLPGILGLTLSDALVLGTSESEVSFSGDNGFRPLFLWSLGIIIFGCISIGAAQAFCLSRIAKLNTAPTLFGMTLPNQAKEDVHHVRADAVSGSNRTRLVPHNNTILWVFLTVTGIFLAMVVSIQANIACFMGAGLVVPGFAIGAVQWIGVRNHGPKASLWFLASGIAWSLGLPIAFWISNMVLKRDPEFGLPYYTMQSALFWGLVATILLIVYGAITGLALVWLVNMQSNKQR